MLVPLVALLLAQTGSGAWASVRPPECADAGGRATNAGERAKSPELRRYCDLVASASSKLARTAGRAEGALDTAARGARGRLDEPLAALSEGEARDPRALDDPLALVAWARVLARTAHVDRATE